MRRWLVVLALLALATVAQADCTMNYLNARGRLILCLTCCTSDGASCWTSCY